MAVIAALLLAIVLLAEISCRLNSYWKPCKITYNSVDENNKEEKMGE
jgi:hypothetical protein